jgi:hypothetical protein
VSTLEKDALRWDLILGRLQPPAAYDAGRIEEIRRKHAADPEPQQEWQDIAADDAGVPRFGEI